MLSIETKGQEENNSNTKQYSVGIIPAFAYDADLGLKYGAVINLFDYKKEAYPDYHQYLLLRLTNSTRNTLNLQSVYESNKLIPAATTFLEAGYTNDQKMDFFGFNGIEAIYNNSFTEPKNELFINKNYYAHQRKLIRLRADVQKNLWGDELRLLTGFTFNKYMLKAFQQEDYTSSLYDDFIEWNVIDQSEISGGNVSFFTAGLIYDTRNDKCYCSKGNWIEAYMVYAPNKLNQQSFSKLILTYRYYQSFNDNNFTLLFRLSSQTKTSGKIPFYHLSNYYDTPLNQDGLGGAYTLRGITRNRILADGFALGNFETRFKLKEFTLFKLDFLISATLFADVAYITQNYQYNTTEIPNNLIDSYINTSKQPLYLGLGPGINILYNKSNIITMNYGFSPNAQFGNGGLYVGSRFLF